MKRAPCASAPSPGAVIRRKSFFRRHPGGRSRFCLRIFRLALRLFKTSPANFGSISSPPGCTPGSCDRAHRCQCIPSPTSPPLRRSHRCLRCNVGFSGPRPPWRLGRLIFSMLCSPHKYRLPILWDSAIFAAGQISHSEENECTLPRRVCVSTMCLSLAQVLSLLSHIIFICGNALVAGDSSTLRP